MLARRLRGSGPENRERAGFNREADPNHQPAKGRNLQAKTGCRTDTLLQWSGMAVEEIITCNTRIEKLRDAFAALAES